MNYVSDPNNMNHDVFISYSSKRSEVANEICDLLERSGLKCWIAPRDIDGENFDDLICNAIVGCRLFVVVFSQEYSLSTWCKAELNLAFSEGKAILPYRIDKTPLVGGFKLKLQNSHCLESSSDYQAEFPKLVQMATQIVGVPAPKPKPEPQPKPQPKPEPPKPQPAPTTKTYKVGDLYDDGTKRGVVFEVTPDGQHGKIVSLEEGQQLWSNEYEYIGATSRTDGMANMRAIQAIGGWREKYPAFAWCADLGEEWYLPAVAELEDLLRVRNVVNEELERHKAKILFGVLWSSTGYGEFCAWLVYMLYGNTYRDTKCYGYYVRAVSAF